MRKQLPSIAAIAATCLLLAWQMFSLSRHHTLLGDFRAFYCGGSVVTHGGNPYSAAPIMACEETPQPFGLHKSPRGLAEPVPYPGYAFALFVPFALLPYVPAALLWTLTMVAALLAACALLAHVIGRPFAGVLAVFALGFGAAVWPYGEVAPLGVLGLALAAYLLRSSRPAPAALALGCAAILPHVAAPAFAALFVWERRSRLALVAVCAALIALDLTIGGPALAFSYFTRVLPAHSQSEIGYITQYGLTWLLHAAGATNRVAVVAGDLSYAVMSVAGIWFGGMLAKKYAEPAFVVLLPAAFALIGGPFVHYSEITLALPALMLLYSRAAGRFRIPVAAALLLVALPWQSALQIELVAAIVTAAFAIAAVFLQAGTLPALRIALVTAGWCAVIVAVGAAFGAQLSSGSAAHLDPRLAQATWAEYVRKNSSSVGIVWVLAKLPTWIGLALLAFCGAYAVVKKDFETAIAIKQVPVEL